MEKKNATGNTMSSVTRVAAGRSGGALFSEPIISQILSVWLRRRAVKMVIGAVMKYENTRKAGGERNAVSLASCGRGATIKASI